MRNFKGICLIILILQFLVGCQFFSSESQIEKEVTLMIEKMSLQDKIAQMLIIYNNETMLTEEFERELMETKVGGYIVFSDNITTYMQTKQFISDIKNCSEIPMFIAIDQEGGRVQRLLSVKDKIATDIPDMKTVGEYDNLKLSYGIGTIIGEEVRSLGVNMVFAPVLDVGDFKTSSLKERIISRDSMVVANNGIKIAEGIFDSGVIAVYKHFPGIANTTVDSHYDLPVIKKTIEELYRDELIPFTRAIQYDNKYKAEMIMVGHVNYPLVTNDSLPSSLSKKIINDLLRNEIGYDGVVITDAINMDALRDYYSEEEIFELGINAGVDIFLMPDSAKVAIDTITNLVLDEKVNEEQINKCVRRILKLKKKYLQNFESLDETYFGSLTHQKIVADYN